ncbi:uncharacterized protein EI90DRAFT_1946266 [Cantharellus anzutake]|uniref:uncharacterized protein n=1 Tax=Cantharellus anzutake TaxID=1750568 RepID=UPI001903811A|nr:uncharacterized protein EI90DRAFT_1946266 [Cantharellus anzutake]KAF8326370.1 hypothetical protein EI90DRAFT_1946266 [Cantharellus anzutake]
MRDSIQRIYGALLTPSKLPDQIHLSQEELVEHIIHDEHFQTYPPARSYQLKFWKHIVEKIELANEEADERIYERHISLLSQGAPSPFDYMNGPPAPSYITRFWNAPSSESNVRTSRRSIALLESRTTIEDGTTGMRTWRASLILAEWLIRRPEIVQKKRVLELGSGVGFLGILIAQLDGMRKSKLDETHSGLRGVPSLALTDVNRTVLERCENNISLPPNWFDATSLDRKESLKAQLEEINAEVIIGADIVYDLDLIHPLIETLGMALSAGSVSPQPYRREGLIALCARSEETLSRFIQAADSRGLDLRSEEWGSLGDDIFDDGWGGESQSSVRLFTVTLRQSRGTTQKILHSIS